MGNNKNHNMFRNTLATVTLSKGFKIHLKKKKNLIIDFNLLKENKKKRKKKKGPRRVTDQ